VDSDGSCVAGKCFCVGSGAQLAYSILDSEDSLSSKSLKDAIRIAKWAIRHATHRDGFSGGYINLLHINETGCHHVERVDSRLLDITN
jgi:20S proteasome subunit beta 5